MSQKHRGNALFQYAIIVALIGAACVPVFSSLGQTVVQMFTDYQNAYSGMNTTISQTTIARTQSVTGSSLLPAGSLGGTPSAPVKACSGSTCNVDFGNFTLTNMPADFNTFVETSGAAGGTTELLSMLSQIATQMEEQGLTTEAEEIKKLASLGHNMALIEEEFERVYDECTTQTAEHPRHCIYGYYGTLYTGEMGWQEWGEPFPKPAGFDETYIQFPADLDYLEAISVLRVGEARNLQIENPTQFANKYNTGSSLNTSFVTAMDSVTSSSTIPDNVKNVVNELAWSVGTVGEDFWTNMYNLGAASGNDVHQQSNWVYDPITGAETKVSTTKNLGFSNIDNYSASRVTHLDSSLICASGKGNSTGTSCH